jgi:hypothetical protein
MEVGFSFNYETYDILQLWRTIHDKLYITRHPFTSLAHNRDQNIIMFLRLEGFTAMTTNITAFWDVTSCGLVEVY